MEATWFSWAFTCVHCVFFIPLMVSLTPFAERAPENFMSGYQHIEDPNTWFRWAPQNYVISCIVSLTTFAETEPESSPSTFQLSGYPNYLGFYKFVQLNDLSLIRKVVEAYNWSTKSINSGMKSSEGVVLFNWIKYVWPHK